MLRYRKGEQQGVMAKKLVYFCLRVLLWTAVWAAAMQPVGLIIDRAVELSDILTFVGAAFGGELDCDFRNYGAARRYRRQGLFDNLSDGDFVLLWHAESESAGRNRQQEWC